MVGSQARGSLGVVGDQEVKGIKGVLGVVGSQG